MRILRFLVNGLLSLFCGLVFGLVWALVFGGFFFLLWPPLGVIVGAVAFCRGFRAGAKYGEEDA